MKRALYNDPSNFYEEEAFEDAPFGGFPARGGRAMNEPRNPAFRMIPNMKKIFVVKSSGVSNPSVRLIQKPPVAQRQRALGYPPGQL
ncbi:hypothetical protein M3Y99_00184600 [Aphelenchoides fujianensis]|nr:hypothetical protein M3Y99_00184600 [Aphelenchoides fujianensis]